MGNSRIPFSLAIHTGRLSLKAFPSRSPGVLGVCDAAVPDCLAYAGDTPGPVGHFDWGDSTGRLTQRLHVSRWARGIDSWTGPPNAQLFIPRLVKRTRYALVVAITPGIERDGAVEVGEDPGHTVVIVRDRLTEDSAVLSFGPRDTVQLFMREQTLGDPSHAISSKDRYTAFIWTIDEQSYFDARAYINTRIGMPEIYDVKHQCTSEAIEVAKRARVALPSALGKLRYAKDRVVDSSTPASLLRGLTEEVKTNPSIEQKPVDMGYFRHYGLYVVEK